MLKGVTAFSGFSSDDLAAAKAFHAGTLGLDVAEGGQDERGISRTE
jgi:hypothetical protein